MELVSVVVVSTLAYELPTARVMQLSVVQDNEPRVSRQVRPHVVMAGRITELVDREVVRPPELLPDKIMRVVHRYLRIQAHERLWTTVYEDIDFVGGRQSREKLDVVLRDS